MTAMDNTNERLSHELEALRVRIEQLESERKENERILEKFRLFKSVVDASPEAIAISDADGKLLYINAAHEKLFGRPFDEAVGLDYRDYYPPQSIQKLNEEQIPALKRGESWEGELDVYGADGRLFPLKEFDGSICDESGKLLYRFGVMHDFSSQRRNEGELRNNEQYLQDVFDAIQDGINVADASLTVQKVNRWIEKKHLKSMPVVGKKCYQAFQERNSPCPDCPAVLTLKTGETHTGEFPCENMEGMEGWVELSSYPMRDREGRVCGIIEHIKDITIRKKAENALRENHAVQQALLSTIPALVYLKDKNFNYLIVNCALADLVGVSAEEMVGKNDYDFFPKEDADKYYRADMEVLQCNRPIMNVEERVIAPDGRVIWASTCKAPFRDRDGNAVGVVGFTLDVTDRKRMEDQMRQAQKMEVVGHLSEGVAHNINNILTGIIGNLNIAQMNASEKVAEHLDRAQKASHRAANLVNDLLRFSRKTELELRDADVNVLVRDAYELARQSIDRRIDVVVDLEENLPPVSADSAQMSTVILNLCVNARDAIQKILEGDCFPNRKNERFVITIKTGLKTLDEASSLKMNHARTGKFIVVSVVDNGVGMDDDTQKRIFEPFYTTKHTVGTGLGLASAFGSVRQHDGWIDFSSEYGVGSSFDLYLPALERSAADPSDGARSSSESLQGNECILIVDDEEMILQLGQEILEDFGYRVITAEDGEAGMESYLQNRDRIDLIVLDLSMPKLSGREMLQKVRTYDSSVKIVISSGYSESVDINELKQLGADGSISKPYYPNELAKAIRSYLD